MNSSTNRTDHTIPVSEFLSLRLYSDTRPHLKLIAKLQKGLILVYRGTELVGEGTGFGVPVVRYKNRTYFSSSSTVQVSQKGGSTTALKQFNLDTIYELRYRKTKIENRAMRIMVRRLSELYEKHRHWRPLLQQSFLNRLGMRNEFVQVKPAGRVTVKYQVNSPRVHVETDINLLNRNHVQKVCILNEQSSKHFRKYYDSSNTVLVDKRIGAWDHVETDWACVTSENGQVGFRLWKLNDAVLCRGTEFSGLAYDWVGLDYELKPETTHFEYDIEVLEGTKPK